MQLIFSKEFFKVISSSCDMPVRYDNKVSLIEHTFASQPIPVE